MTTLRLVAMLSVLSLLFSALAQAQSDGCRQFLMRHDELRQLYAWGDGMALRVPPVPNRFAGLTAVRVHEVARRKLRAHGLYDPDGPQWLEISVSLDGARFDILMSLGRWADDLVYGLPGESTVWGVGGGGRHEGSAGRVLTRVVLRPHDVTHVRMRGSAFPFRRGAPAMCLLFLGGGPS